MGNIELPIYQQSQRNQIENDGRSDQSVAKPDPRQAFSGAVIFGHGVQRNTPPKISVNLNVPLIPASVSGIAPAFFVKQLKQGA